MTVSDTVVAAPEGLVMGNDRLSSWLWLAVGALYLIAAVLTLLLAVAMNAWPPLLATAASALAAAACVLTGLDDAPAPASAKDPLPPHQ
jgi:hypothetical protein